MYWGMSNEIWQWMKAAQEPKHITTSIYSLQCARKKSGKEEEGAKILRIFRGTKFEMIHKTHCEKKIAFRGMPTAYIKYLREAPNVLSERESKARERDEEGTALDSNTIDRVFIQLNSCACDIIAPL